MLYFILVFLQCYSQSGECNSGRYYSSACFPAHPKCCEKILELNNVVHETFNKRTDPAWETHSTSALVLSADLRLTARLRDAEENFTSFCSACGDPFEETYKRYMKQSTEDMPVRKLKGQLFHAEVM
jgi:hypothetical protein